jgi:hypothetical protein
MQAENITVNLPEAAKHYDGNPGETQDQSLDDIDDPSREYIHVGDLSVDHFTTEDLRMGLLERGLLVIALENATDEQIERVARQLDRIELLMLIAALRKHRAQEAKPA